MSSTESATPDSAGVARVDLMPRLDLSTANELAEIFRKSDTDIVADATRVTHIGALGLQVLIAAARTAHAKGRRFDIENLGEKPCKQLQSFGVRPDALAEKAGPLTQGDGDNGEASAI